MSIHGPAHYALEKLAQTADFLAVGEGDVRSRLAAAFSIFAYLKVDDFPEHLRKDFEWVIVQLTRFGPRYDHQGKQVEGSVDHTMHRIQNRTGRKIAARLVYLYHEIESHVYPR